MKIYDIIFQKIKDAGASEDVLKELKSFEASLLSLQRLSERGAVINRLFHSLNSRISKMRSICRGNDKAKVC